MWENIVKFSKVVLGVCSYNCSVTCRCGTGAPQPKLFYDGSIIHLLSKHCSLVSACGYRNCHSSPYLHVLMIVVHKFILKDTFFFFPPEVCSFTTGFGLCELHMCGTLCQLPYWVTWLAGGHPCGGGQKLFLTRMGWAGSTH